MKLPFIFLLSCCVVISSCGTQTTTLDTSGVPTASSSAANDFDPRALERGDPDAGGTTIWDAFGSSRTVEQTVAVNRYLWSASLEVLNFLPVQSVDPFTGVIITGFGTPPGSGRAYRATILIDDPALDARSLNVSLQTRNGPASAASVRAVENAILSRARQLRIADDAL